MSFICHIHNYTEYNEEGNVFSAFNPSKCTHTLGAVGSQHCGARGAVGGSVPCPMVSPQSWSLPARAGIRTHNLGLPRVSSPTLYPLGHDCPHEVETILFLLCQYGVWSVDWSRVAKSNLKQFNIRQQHNKMWKNEGVWIHSQGTVNVSVYLYTHWKPVVSDKQKKYL